MVEFPLLSPFFFSDDLAFSSGTVVFPSHPPASTYSCPWLWHACWRAPSPRVRPLSSSPLDWRSRPQVGHFSFSFRDLFTLGKFFSKLFSVLPCLRLRRTLLISLPPPCEVKGSFGLDSFLSFLHRSSRRSFSPSQRGRISFPLSNRRGCSGPHEPLADSDQNLPFTLFFLCRGSVSFPPFM